MKIPWQIKRCEKNVKNIKGQYCYDRKTQNIFIFLNVQILLLTQTEKTF